MGWVLYYLSCYIFVYIGLELLLIPKTKVDMLLIFLFAFVLTFPAMFICIFMIIKFFYSEIKCKLF